ncbi:Sialidase [Talaromyces proteolyticus]|uniref:Sialidase n=1 Tax=Talaromyces proteolyticus TaxID=1131652 RepID=A0AAD4PXC2_9EURO|nr:Sialidase [Talaromyces proteolyticus]KAH8696244.1 Sialidase [Talaromyces proteolyticus]
MASLRCTLPFLTLFLPLLLPLAAANVTISGSPSVMGNGSYPRATYINDKSLLGCYQGMQDGILSIQTVRSTDNGTTWSPWSTVLSENQTEYTPNNCYLHQLPDSDRILLAFRNPKRDASGKNYIHHIISVYSSDDNGKSWANLSTVATTNTTGLGLWEPFMMDGLDGDLLLFFSRETRTDGKDQNSILVRSSDAGKTWGKELTISGGDVQKRDGMLGAARLAEGSESMIAVFESLGPNTGITSVTSDDDGKIWNKPRGKVYASNEGKITEAAPQVVLVGKTLVASFSTKEDNFDSEHFDVKVVTSKDGGKTWGEKTTVHKECHWAGEVTVDDNSLLVLCDNKGVVVAQRVEISE